MQTPGHACISVDLDGLWCYHEIHGLGARDDAIDPAYSVGVRRLLDFFEQLGQDFDCKFNIKKI